MIHPNWPVESTAFIGQPGALVPIPVSDRSGIDVKENAGWSFRTTTTGKVHGQRLVSQRRSWDVDLGELPDTYLAMLRVVGSGGYGPGPFYWLTPYVQKSNVVTPDDSLMRNITARVDWLWTPNGPQMVGSDLVPQTVVRAEPSPYWEDVTVPFLVRPDGPMAVGVLLRGTSQQPCVAQVSWRNSMGVELGVSPFVVPGSYTSWAWARASFTPAAGAVTGVIQVKGAVGVAAPYAVWNDAPPPLYAMGGGCHKAAMTEPSTAWGAFDPSGGFWTRVTFEVRELG